MTYLINYNQTAAESADHETLAPQDLSPRRQTAEPGDGWRGFNLVFFSAETPDGWAIPGVHGSWAADETQGYVQGGVFLIESRGEGLLVDTGNRVPDSEVSMGPAIVERLERRGTHLRTIVITHFHYDHTGNAAELKARFGARVVAHALDRPVIEDPLIVTRPANALRFGVSPEELLADFNLGPGETFGLSDPDVVRRYWDFPVPVDEEVGAGDVLEVGDLALEVVHLPGHSPGQIGLWNPATRSLYAADIGHFPSPLVPYPVGNAADHIRTLELCQRLEPDYLWEGHHLGSYERSASWRRLEHLLQAQRDLADRLELLLRRASRPLAIAELLPEVFPVKLELNYPVPAGRTERWAYAEAAIQTHLQRLVELDRARRIHDDDGRSCFVAA